MLLTVRHGGYHHSAMPDLCISRQQQTNMEHKSLKHEALHPPPEQLEQKLRWAQKTGSKHNTSASPVDGPREALALAEDLFGRLRVRAHIRERTHALCSAAGFQLQNV